MESDDRWQALISNPQFKSIQRGQARRVRALCQDEKEAEATVLSNLFDARDKVLQFAERGQWGGVTVIAQRRVSSWLRKEVPLVPANEDPEGGEGGAGDEDGQGGRKALGSRPSLRRRFVSMADDDWPQLMDPSMSAEDRFALLQAALMVRACLEQFAQRRPRDAALLREAFLEGRSRAELARARGINSGAVRQRLLTAGRRFHAFLEEGEVAKELRPLL